jgi:hypothetical protein
MVSNTMAKRLFSHSIGGSAASAPVDTHAISVGGGKFDPSRVSHKGYPGAESARKVPEGNAKPKMNSSSGGAPAKSPAANGKVEPPKGKGKSA